MPVAGVIALLTSADQVKKPKNHVWGSSDGPQQLRKCLYLGIEWDINPWPCVLKPK
jgi:hypothetical protein